MSWLDALGWAGSALLVISLLQARVLRFRVLNTVACVVLIAFNAILAIWPMVAMNVVLTTINLWFIWRLLSERRPSDAGGAYTVLEVDETDTYLQHFLRIQRSDIVTFFPGFRELHERPDRTAYLVQHGHETVGVVIVRDVGDGVAEVEVDYVTPQYRDLSPGEFVYRSSGLFRQRGFRRILTPRGMLQPYYDRLGFAKDGDRWALEVT